VTVTMPQTDANSDSTMNRVNTFLDKYVLPYPVRYLTNRITILATLGLLVPLILLANVTVFVLAANSYLNVMSVVVSSTVLLYSTISEARDRAASARREEIARTHEARLEARAQADHEAIEMIHEHLDGMNKELLEHVNKSLDNIQQILMTHLDELHTANQEHVKGHISAVQSDVAAHRQEMASLAAAMKVIQSKLGMDQ
jgi:hypothetical protein